MNRTSAIEALFVLLETRGNERYGEEVTQLEHALQCSALARRDGATDTLIVAALFHDIGHLYGAPREYDHPEGSRHHDQHDALGAQVLAPLFGTSVGRPVALHVTAKRWRCTIEPNYHRQLSSSSQATLMAQGGLMDARTCHRFEMNPGFEGALALRSWDDEGKVPDLEVGELRDYEPTVHRLAQRLTGVRL